MLEFSVKCKQINNLKPLRRRHNSNPEFINATS